MIRFTKDEKIVILFLLIAFLVGSAVLYYKKINPKPCAILRFSEKKAAKSQKVNVNTAGKDELVKLKNIGPVLAGRIISYRKKNGPFRSAEELKSVKGIGDKTYRAMERDLALE